MIDTPVLEYLYSIRSMPWTHFYIWVSEFGILYTVIALTLVCTLLLYLRGRYADIAGLLVATGGTGLAVYVLKNYLALPRPDAAFQAYVESGFTFPSGHTAGSLALYGFMTYLVFTVTRSKLWRGVALAGFSLLILLIAFSRLYLGVHYVTDVVAGALVAGVFLWLGIRIALSSKP